MIRERPAATRTTLPRDQRSPIGARRPPTNSPRTPAVAHRVSADGRRGAHSLVSVGAYETDIEAGGYLLRVRVAGALDGRPTVHFHGTPGCRLELVWAEATAEAEGVRLITFDRPGYGRSPSAQFGLLSVAHAVLQVAEALGVERFWTMGQSGGGPFALATAFVAGDQVVAAGSASGAAPLMLLPDADADMWEADKEGVRLLPTDPDAAVEAVAGGLDLGDALADEASLIEAFRPVLSRSDLKVLENPLYARAFLDESREALKAGKTGYAWDNLAYLPAWEFDPSGIGCPVYLWYGDEDLMAKPAHAYWLQEHIPTARLVMRQGTGHLGIFDHLADMLRELIGPAH
jgi:pimeloyl-ACP methyl ester carboxylesterase